MPPIEQKLKFTAWKRSKLFDKAVRGDSRLIGSVKLELKEPTDGSAFGDISFTLMAAADVAGLKPGAILRTAPIPFARDAETTKFVHVDFTESDFPWRYTPQRHNGDRLRPWLVLIVGVAEDLSVEGDLVKSDNQEVLKDHKLSESYLWAHVQDDGHSRLISPLKLKPQREYVAAIVPAFNEKGQDMWDALGKLTSKEPLRAFHSWRFWTAEAGDFETLSAALRIRSAGDLGRVKLTYQLHNPEGAFVTLETRGAITSLRAELDRLDPDEMNDKQLLDALVSLKPLPGNVNPEPLPIEEKRALLKSLIQPVVAGIENAKTDLDQFNDQLEDDPPAGWPKREIIGLPHYGRPWLPDPDSINTGWPGMINDDPRYRGIAGLGLWMGVEGQEELVNTAVEQAGALNEASLRIGRLALGLHAAGSLWQRRLPNDANLRLRIFGPMMGRMIAQDGSTVLDRVTSSASLLPGAIFSTAAQRLLRDRSSHSRHIKDGMDRSEALNIANTSPPWPDEAERNRAPEGLPHLDHIVRDLGLPTLEDWLKLSQVNLDNLVEKIERLMHEHVELFARERQGLNEEATERLRESLAERLFGEYWLLLRELLFEIESPCEAQQIVKDIEEILGISLHELLKRCLDDESFREQQRAALLSALRRCLASRRCNQVGHLAPNQIIPLCRETAGNLPPIPPAPQARPIELARLSERVSKAIDPRGPDSPARRRVTGLFEGLDLSTLAPPEFPIGLDFPTWNLLKKYDKEWLLPGGGTLEKDSIVALQTNPTFIDAFMVGINTQFINEMLWRNLAVNRESTPLRMFWGFLNYASGKREADIQPLKEWAKAPTKDLGDLSHQTIKPGDTTGKRDLVVLFRTDLFRRYPSTLVYLFKPPQNLDPTQLEVELKKTPDFSDSAENRANRRYFGPIFLADLQPDMRFFLFDVDPGDLDQYWLVLDEPPAELRFRNDKTPNIEHGGTFAKTTIDEPTRVAISGAELKKLGLN